MKQFKEGEHVYVVSRVWKTIHEFIFGFQIKGEDTCFVFPIGGGYEASNSASLCCMHSSSRAF